ncbi:MAG: hypothetical protein IT383_09910 [Deltaproteobacteria bacterium]|nr:hypothetical protein [Deltaproteobacteria bacterium]
MSRAPAPDQLGARFLLLLESIVTDRGPIFPGAGFSVGVRTQDGNDLWLAVAVRPQFRVGYTDQPSPSGDFSLLLDWRDAESILRTGELPALPTRLELRGDAAGLDRFVSSYLTNQSPLAMRLRAQGGAR